MSAHDSHAACDHDWRADPQGYVYTSSPPAQKLVCAKCGAIDWRYAEMPRISRDPKEWPKA